MSTKFKPTKRRDAAVAVADDGVVDDWEAADESEATSSTSTAHAKAVVRDAWDDDDDEHAFARNVLPSAQGRALWEEANRSAPQAQPIIANRTLPTTLLAPRIATPTSHSEYDDRRPPQILRRDRKAEAEAAAAAASALAAQGGEAKPRTMAQREQDYRKARERIFGAAATEKSSSPSSRNASGSDVGGSSSPGGGGGGAAKTERRKR